MIFRELEIFGAYVIEPELLEDSRGFFARVFCSQAFGERRLVTAWPQCNLSYNAKRGTLRGMHYQEAPHGEVKLVRCLAGAIFDVIVDLRPSSPTYLTWTGVELSATNRHALYIPEGLAHGFQTLTDGAELYYHMSRAYVPGAARGLRWNDPTLQIAWPEVEERIISERDAAFSDFTPA